VSVPELVKRQLRVQLWDLADQVGWMDLSPTEKRKLYEQWTSDQRFGGALSRYIDKGFVRVYLKDTIMREYARAAGSNSVEWLRLLKISTDAPVVQVYVKPHGRRLSDGRVISWGRASGWKLVLMTLYERSATLPGSTPFAAILTNSDGKFAETNMKRTVEEAAFRLGIEKVVWR
jgi:hypothetical protein